MSKWKWQFQKASDVKSEDYIIGYTTNFKSEDHMKYIIKEFYIPYSQLNKGKIDDISSSKSS